MLTEKRCGLALYIHKNKKKKKKKKKKKTYIFNYKLQMILTYEEFLSKRG